MLILHWIQKSLKFDVLKMLSGSLILSSIDYALPVRGLDPKWRIFNVCSSATTNILNAIAIHSFSNYSVHYNEQNNLEKNE